MLDMLIQFFMKLFGGKSEAQPLPAGGNTSNRGAFAKSEPEDETEEQGDDHVGFDLAGFDLERDEAGYFEARQYLDSEGMIAPNVTITEADHAHYMAKYGLKDRAHWNHVRDCCFSQLAKKYGDDGVTQRMMNAQQALMQRLMQNNTKAVAASGELNPVEGIGLEQWAAMNAAIAQGANPTDLLKGAGIDQARWDRARTEWEARMSRDTTFSISQIYGTAFQNASTGKYAAFAKEAAAARIDCRDLTMQPPVTVEQFWTTLYEQAYGAKQGKDPSQVLKGMGLTVVDWCDLASFMGYHIQRTWGANNQQYTETMKRVEAQFTAKYPGVKADVDIAF